MERGCLFPKEKRNLEQFFYFLKSVDLSFFFLIFPKFLYRDGSQIRIYNQPVPSVQQVPSLVLTENVKVGLDNEFDLFNNNFVHNDALYSLSYQSGTNEKAGHLCVFYKKLHER